MSRTPEQVLVKVREKARQEASRLEALIDAEMDRVTDDCSYHGGDLAVHAGYGGVSHEVVAELRRRYSGWDIRVGLGSGTLFFRPKPPPVDLPNAWWFQPSAPGGAVDLSKLQS